MAHRTTTSAADRASTSDLRNPSEPAPPSSTVGTPDNRGGERRVEEFHLPQAADRRPWVDPDVDAGGTGPSSRPLHLRGRYLYVVMLGGMLGTVARWWLGERLGTLHGWPVGTLAANLLGCLALGWLLEGLLRSGPDRGWMRLARLHFGTGFCGAFTTYSSLATETALLVRHGSLATAIGYLALSVVVGCAMAWVGIRLAVATTGKATRGGAA